jgi:hypothetical protein
MEPFIDGQEDGNLTLVDGIGLQYHRNQFGNMVI